MVRRRSGVPTWAGAAVCRGQRLGNTEEGQLPHAGSTVVPFFTILAEIGDGYLPMYILV